MLEFIAVAVLTCVGSGAALVLIWATVDFIAWLSGEGWIPTWRYRGANKLPGYAYSSHAGPEHPAVGIVKGMSNAELMKSLQDPNWYPTRDVPMKPLSSENIKDILDYSRIAREKQSVDAALTSVKRTGSFQNPETMEHMIALGRVFDETSKRRGF